MVQLFAGDVQNRQIIEWNGVHLFHYPMSSCSQKVRIFSSLKAVAWEPHLVDLAAQENCDPWFLAINPRGLVPVLVLDGAVHIESNDIIEVLEAGFPEPVLIPADLAPEILDLLKQEDDLHLDLRRLSFRFVHGRTGSTKTPETLEAYRTGGSGTVEGQADRHKEIEIDFYERLAREGLTDAACRMSASKFRAAFDGLDARLAGNPYLLGERLTVLDIAWFVYAYRLLLGGYPLARLHPRVDRWFRRLRARPEFAKEVDMPPALRRRIEANRRNQLREEETLSQVAGFSERPLIET